MWGVSAGRAAGHPHPPPAAPAPGVGLGDALIWAVSIAVGGATAKVLAQRAAAAGMAKATGEADPH
jgi:hypothetical protein